MPQADPRVLDLFARVDRFLQWDLVTVTPWGAPSISPVGARLIPDEATVWTSTTVGYAAKVRNIRAHPRVALMRSHPDEGALLIRGEARIVGGDGTANLARLFQLMGGAGGARPFFATSASDPFWSRLYRAYWQRLLIGVRIVEIATMGPAGWAPLQVASWSSPRVASSKRARRRLGPPLERLDPLGRAMIEEGTPAAFATVRREGSCPAIWPVTAALHRGGAISVDAGFPLPEGRLSHSSLAVRVIDDSFEVARLAGWIGTLEPGHGTRLLLPRARYGFAKPPGVLGDLAAGTAALVRALVLPGPTEVSPPDLARALQLGGSDEAARLELPEPVWVLLKQFFARRNAAAPWYAAMASVVPDPALRNALRLLSARAQLERDWVQALLARGSRRVSVAQLVVGALAVRPNPAAPEGAAAREEAQVGRLRTRLAGQLPAGLGGPLGRPGHPARSDPSARGGGRGGSEPVAATLAAVTSLAAALDRWQRHPSQ